jgi:uncharacterized protein (DUF58 family)
MDFAEVRKYVPGDDIRSIDWHVTARTGKTHTKVFNEEKERPVFLIVDQSSAMFFGSQRYTKAVIAAQAAALAGFHTLKTGDRFGGIVFDDDESDYVIPRRSKATLQHFLQCLVQRMEKLPARKKAESNRDLLKKYLMKAAGAVTTNHVVAVISDFTDLDEEGRQHLIDLSLHNDVILIHVTDPLDAKLPEGKLVVADGEHQIIWQNSKRQAGKKYEERFQDMSEKFPRDMLHYNMPVVVLDTLSAGNDQLVKHVAKAFSR